MTAHLALAPRPALGLGPRLAAGIRLALPALSFAVVLLVLLGLNPRVASYAGFTLMLGLATPIVLATLSQMFVMTLGDIDLSTGPFVSMVACIGATLLTGSPAAAAALMGLAVLGYVMAGLLVEARSLPSIVVTLGLSFMWSGFAVLLLPSPGGQSPAWLHAALTVRPPVVPLPFLVAAVAGLLLHWLLMRSSLGVLLRAAGGSRIAMLRANWSMLAIRALVYGLAGVFGVLAGLALLGLTTAADANIANRYTLLSIAGVILGGGEFTGGRVSPVGAVFGALTLSLTGTLLTFLRISPDWQVGAQGLILIVVLAVRVLTAARRSSGSEAE